jgi:hypothetical protein
MSHRMKRIALVGTLSVALLASAGAHAAEDPLVKYDSKCDWVSGVYRCYSKTAPRAFRCSYPCRRTSRSTGISLLA